MPDSLYKVLKERADMWARGDLKAWLKYAGYCHDPAKMKLEDMFKVWRERKKKNQ